MIRRRRPSALALAVLLPLAAATVSSCATFTDNANAARVGEVEFPRADLERYLADALEARDAADVPDEVSGELYRQVIGSWIFDELVRQFLAEQGIEITEADRAAAAEQLDLQLDGLELSDFVRDYEIDSLSTRLAFENASASFEGTLLDFADDSTVYVDPLYGYWDLDSGAIRPMAS